ncbi:MAG: hypothetical protein NT136_00745 [Candidatus Moranbacteria bacterium]|nr:hypothetical protein [Candidatus Moranbacteria bacterium]
MEFCTIPSVVSSTKNPDDETRENIIKRHEKFLKLPEEIKDKLVFQETGKRIQEIGQASSLQLLQLADIARAVRNYYFGELKLEDMPAVLAREIGIDLNKAREIANQVVQKIIRDKSYIKTAETISLPLSQALQKYPALGEQLITVNPIRLKILPTPVRPSAKNWITDYHEKLGVGKHEVMERGNYLYHSENTKRLTPGERQKLAVILKSLDENEPIAVDAEKQEIVFPHPETLSQRERGQVNKANSANKVGYRFSSPQRFAVEKQEPAPPPQRPTSPPAPPEVPPAFHKPPRHEHQPYHIYPLGYPEPPRPPEKTEPKIDGNTVDLRN